MIEESLMASKRELSLGNFQHKYFDRSIYINNGDKTFRGPIHDEV